MKPVRVLDPGHVLAVCTHAAHEASEPGGTGENPTPNIALTTTEQAVTIRIAADVARIAAILGALHRAGYAADANGDTITVHGWSRAHLHRRIARLDAAVQWLTEQLAFTPRTAVAYYQAGIDDQGVVPRAARDTARHEVVHNLRELIEHQTGPFTSHDQPVQPADPRTGMLLRQCRWLENDIEQLLDRHRTIATQAIAEHRLTTETTQHNHATNEAEQVAPAEADRASHPVDARPAAVAAHDAPAEADTPTAPGTNGMPPVRGAHPATAPARRGA